MYNFFRKLFKTNKKLTPKDSSFLNIYKNTEISKLFDSISNFKDTSEIRYVGGCLRKILNNEEVDDIDLATNLNPSEVSEILKKNNINVHLKENQQIRLQQHKLEEQLLHLNLFLTSRKSKKLMKNFQSIDLRYKNKIAIKHF